MLLIIALIHFAPLVGVISANKLELLYQVNVSDGNLEILMRHRAILFGLLAAFFAYAAFQPSLQIAAFVAAAISILSFLFLAHSVGHYNPGIAKVVIADYVALGCLTVAIAAYWMKSP